MSFLAHPVGNIYDGAWRKRCVAYHDDGEGHGQPRDAGEERRGSYESHRARVHPLPERIGRHSAVDVDEHAPDRSTVQTADKPASQHSPSPAAPPRRAGRRYFALWSFHTLLSGELRYGPWHVALRSIGAWPRSAGAV